MFLWTKGRRRLLKDYAQNKQPTKTKSLNNHYDGLTIPE
jgi:hypothetical protein